MAQQIINYGGPPVQWKKLSDSFELINSNFTELYTTVAAFTGGVLDFSNIGSNLSPATDAVYDLGSPSKRWNNVYVSGSSFVLGNATITAVGTTLNLPTGTTVGGQSLEALSQFQNIAVSGQSTVSADGNTDTLTLAAGLGVSITTDASTDTITFTNSGVRSVTAGTNITLSGTANNPVINSSGIQSVSGTANKINATNVSGAVTLTLPDAISGLTSVTATTFAGELIGNASTATNAVNSDNTKIVNDVSSNSAVYPTWVTGLSGNLPHKVSETKLYFVPGTGDLHATRFRGDGSLLTGVSTKSFSKLEVFGQPQIEADLAADTLTLVAGANVTITTDAGTDAITISAASGPASVTDSFRTIAVSGQSSVIADSATDTLTLVAGSGIGITTDSGTDTITITNTASVPNVFSTFAVDGSNIVADSSSDTLTITAGSNITLDVDPTTDTFTINAVIPAPSINCFSNIEVFGQSTVSADSSNDTFTIVAGTGISITTNGTNDSITIVNTDPNLDQFAFTTVAVAGQSTITADQSSDTLTLVAGSGITITTNATTDTVTITNSAPAPTINSFSTLAVSGQQNVVADSSSDTLTLVAGSGITITTNQSTDEITFAVGSVPSIGDLTITGTTIDSNDSSGITFTPIVTFNSDAVIENDLVANSIRANSIVTTGTGSPVLESDTTIELSAAERVSVSNSPFRVAVVTTDQRDTISAVNGDIIYNSTVDKFQGYSNSIWVNLH